MQKTLDNRKPRVSSTQLWMQENLFSTPLNTVLTVLSSALVLWVVISLSTWAFTQARWAVIPANFRLLMVGPFPIEQIWRVWTVLIVVSLTAGLHWGSASKGQALTLWPFVTASLIALFALVTQWGFPSSILVPASVAALFAGFFVGRAALSSRAMNFAWLFIFFVALGFLGADFVGVPARLLEFRPQVLNDFIIKLQFDKRLLDGTITQETFRAVTYFQGIIFSLSIGALYLLIKNLKVIPVWFKFFLIIFSSATLIYISLHSLLWLLGYYGANTVDSKSWGGFLLTMILAIVGIVASFPLGVALAIGRTSQYPIISAICTVFIEVVRGTPLVVVFFIAQLFVPLLLGGSNIDALFRAMIGITIFSAAYLAENVRGGLQSLPSGQVEAARALGLTGTQTLLLIVLPQALKAVVPALVGQGIALFKDTSLVYIIGLKELTTITNSIRNNPDFIGTEKELFFTISVIYFIFSYAMSSGARALEHRLNTNR